MSDQKTKPTRERVLESACKIFAEKGFRDATVAEICDAANANIASVNYHFGDKETLYDEVWRHAFSITIQAYPTNEGVTEDTSPEDLLYAFANALIHRMFCENEAGHFAKLLYREMASPTLALEKIAEEAVFPQAQVVDRILKKAFGDTIDEQAFMLCKQSIIGQCAFYNFSRPLRSRIMGKEIQTDQELNRIARHIAQFSMGGLQEVIRNPS